MPRFQSPSRRIGGLEEAAKKYHLQDNGDGTADLITTQYGTVVPVAYHGAVLCDTKKGSFSGQQVAYYLATGEDPNADNEHVIRLKDGDPSNMHPDNLVQDKVTGPITCRCGYANSHSEFMGVYRSKTGRWTAKVQGRTIPGCWDSEQAASIARNEYIKQMELEEE